MTEMYVNMNDMSRPLRLARAGKVSVAPRATETGDFPPVRLAPDRGAYALAYGLNVCFESEWRRVRSSEYALIHGFNSSPL